MNNNSRLTKKEEVKAYKRLIFLFLMVFASIILFVLVGIPLLISVSSLITSFNDSSKPIQVKDTVAPFPPRFDSIPEATNSATILIKGYSEPGSTVKLDQDSSTICTVVSDNEGSFTCPINLHSGVNAINAIAIDQAGNKSSISQTYNVIAKNTPPKLEVQEPSDGKTVTGSNAYLTVSGTTEQGVAVTVNDRFATVDQDGKFQTSITLNSGDNTIRIVAKDKAGNENKIERKINYSP